jgi:hypothetical protein
MPYPYFCYIGQTLVKIDNATLKWYRKTAIAMEVLDIKREVETLSQRLGKTQDYL